LLPKKVKILYIYIINTKYKGLLNVFKQKQTSNFGQSGGEKSLSFVRVFSKLLL
jgi:hypothetical protein